MEAKPQAQRGPKEGEWISRRADGTIKTRVNYQNGIKHGTSYLFYDDGKTVHLEMPYVVGARHGASKKYFRDGTLYAETNYSEDRLDGVRSTYYRNGKVKSRLTYRDGNPGLDLEEYLQDGKMKSKPEITHQVVGNRLELSLENGKRCSAPEMYLGELLDGFFDKSLDFETISQVNGRFEIDLNVYSKSYIEMQEVICKCKSSQGNPLIIKKRLKF